MIETACAAALGFRVKSGWATAVLVAGPAASPRVIDRRSVELCDPRVPESRQPYHAGLGTLEENDSEIRRRTGVVRRVAEKSIKALLQAHRSFHCTPSGAALVVGSLIDPGAIANPHIRAHALEGKLFRSVLAAALESSGLSCIEVVEREVYEKAAGALGRKADEVKRAVSALGRGIDGPWRAEEKLATAAAWMRLA